VTRIYDTHLQPVGLTLTQYSVLSNLARGGPPSVNGMAEMLGMDRTTLTRTLKPLIAARFVSSQSVDQAQDAVHNADATLEAEHAGVGVAQTQLDQARYALDQTIIRAPIDGRIVRRYANPGVGASTLQVTAMFDLEPVGARIVRAEVPESAEPFVAVGQPVQLVAEADQSKSYPGKVLRIAPVFGERKLQSDDPSARTDDRVVEVVASADNAPFLIGQRVLVKFVKAR